MVSKWLVPITTCLLACVFMSSCREQDSGLAAIDNPVLARTDFNTGVLLTVEHDGHDWVVCKNLFGSSAISMQHSQNCKCTKGK